MKKQIIFFCTLLTQLNVFAEPQRPIILKDTIVIFDTVVVIKHIPDDKTVGIYQEILEKTNQQLNLWWNPYVLIISILSVFFTVMAIIAAIIIFRQGKESKRLIEDSMIKHKTALDNLIKEKQNQFKIYESSVNNLILEFTEKLKSAGEDQKQQLTEIISKLEIQKHSIDIHINSYKHSGWRQQDIPVTAIIDNQTNFFAKIYLNDLKQEFVIYIRILASDNKNYWIGFAGNIQNTNSKSTNEFTRHQLYNSNEITIQENIMSAFNLGFENNRIFAKEVNCVRLRGSNTNKNEITFEFKIY